MFVSVGLKVGQIVNFEYFVVEMVGQRQYVEYLKERSEIRVNLPKTVIGHHHLLDKLLHLFAHDWMKVGCERKRL